MPTSDEIWAPCEPQSREMAYAHWDLPKTSPESGEVSQLTLTWQPGSDIIGDFVWCDGRYEIVVRATIASELAGLFLGLRFGKVKFDQDPGLAGPKPRSRKRVWLPYVGPELKWLCPTTVLEPDVSRSTIVTTDEGNYQYKGLERYNIEILKDDAGKNTYLNRHIPRKPGEGILIPRSEYRGDCFFRIPRARWPLCTNGVKEFIESHNFTNITFRSYGEFF